MENIEEFEKAKLKLKNYIEQLKEQLGKKEQELENVDLDETLSERKKEYKKEIWSNEINRLKVQIKNNEERLSFYRPSTKEIEEYKVNIMKNYNKNVCEAIPDDLHLLFHGTNIYCAKDIIKDGGIYSPGERGQDSAITSTGVIWVTSKYSGTGINTTLSYTFGENNDRFNPPGCIFVLKTDEKTEKEAGHMLSTTSVNFDENPEVLFAIITSTESKEMVSKWCEENGLDSNKVYDYESFLQMLKERNQSKEKNGIENESTNEKNKREQFIEEVKVEGVTPIVHQIDKQNELDITKLEENKEKNGTCLGDD